MSMILQILLLQLHFECDIFGAAIPSPPFTSLRVMGIASSPWSEGKAEEPYAVCTHMLENKPTAGENYPGNIL